MIAAAGSVLLVILLAIGLPVAFAMAVAGTAGIWFVSGFGSLIGIIKTTTVSSVASYELITIPMFILMAEFIIVSKIADELFDATAVWVGRTPGGLGVATVLAGAFFGAISGSSTASAATLSSTSIPAMMRQGYTLRFAGGLVATTGTLAMLIPPSVALVLYGIIADVSIGRLLIAGIVPGLLVAVALMLVVFITSLARPSQVPAGRAYSIGSKLRALKVTGPMLALFAAVTGVLYLGIATPTEAAALGAFGAFLLSVLYRRLTMNGFLKALTSAARISCMIGLIIIGAHLFGYFFTLTRATQSIADWIIGLNASPYMVLLILLIIYVLLGCFLDQVAILILTVPVVLPIVVGVGFDPVWFGVVVVITAEIGMITPPMGMNVFVVARYTGRSVHEIFAGVVPFLVAVLSLIVIFAVWPQIVMWLPNRMAN